MYTIQYRAIGRLPCAELLYCPYNTVYNTILAAKKGEGDLLYLQYCPYNTILLYLQYNTITMLNNTSCSRRLSNFQISSTPNSPFSSSLPSRLHLPSRAPPPLQGTYRVPQYGGGLLFEKSVTFERKKATSREDRNFSQRSTTCELEQEV